MKIVIGHYHLNPGGVTKIIESQVKSLLMIDPRLELTVICGGWSEQSFHFPENVNLIVYPALNYLKNKNDNEFDLKKAYAEISGILHDLAEKNDVIHFHNATLGKNPLISISLYNLALEGRFIINHAHDFAEDRPLNMSFLKHIIEGVYKMNLEEVLYPSLKTYVMAVINSTDEGRVLDKGFDRARLHKWLNPVSIPNIPQETTRELSKERLITALSLDPGKKIVSYPVRVIRRKNIGEFILLAWLFEEQASWLVTQPPNNPVEITFYNGWVRFSKEHGIHVAFEAGQKADFSDVMRGSDVCITTSTMEGFGMVFVEPWFWGTPVKGRTIPAVMGDLKASGIHFPFLYEALIVEHSGVQCDFASLDDEQQRDVIKLAMQQGKDAMLTRNPHLEKLLENVESSVIEENKKALTKSLSEQQYGYTLFELYKSTSGRA